MKDELISRAEVMKALTEEYNRRHTEQNGLQLAYIEKAVNSVDSWRSMDEEPKQDSYVLVSFSNFTLCDIASYRDGLFYPGDSEKPYRDYGLIVNGWMPTPKNRED